jgi:uncharacterized membrane protein
MQSETSFLYLALLIISILGLIGIDRKHKLALFNNSRATLASIAIAVAVFLVWDVVVTLPIYRVFCLVRNCLWKSFSS